MDAEGFHDEVPCPECGSLKTVTYRYVEGFSELECPTCGYRSDSQELADLTRYPGVLAEHHSRVDDAPRDHSADDLPPVPIRAMKA